MELDNLKQQLQRLKKCDQAWDEMAPVAGGRQCAKCDQRIVDFTGMDQREIAFFMAEQEAPSCGFYLPEQLPPYQRKNSWWPVSIGLSALLTSFSNAAAAPVTQEVYMAPADNTATSAGETPITTDTVIITGNIQTIDTLQGKTEKLAGTTILIKGTKTGTSANANGDFRLVYTPESKTITLVIAYIGFNKQEITLTNVHQQKEINVGNITMVPDTSVIRYYVTVTKSSKKTTFLQRLTKPFRRHQ
jgi:CarboxypepD_reg-like domain